MDNPHLIPSPSSMSQTQIRTNRLLLRGAREEDLDAFHQWFRDPHAMHFWSSAPLSIQKTKEFLDSMISSPHNGVLDFAVCLLPSESTNGTVTEDVPIVIGKAGIWDGSEIGFILNRAHWGKGYAYEAIEAIVQRYWETHTGKDAPPIKADVDPRNEASLRILKRLGFRIKSTAERTFETHIGWCDSSVYLEMKRPVG